jgi:hypothetical protein
MIRRIVPRPLQSLTLLLLWLVLQSIACIYLFGRPTQVETS